MSRHHLDLVAWTMLVGDKLMAKEAKRALPTGAPSGEAAWRLSEALVSARLDLTTQDEEGNTCFHLAPCFHTTRRPTLAN